MNRPNVRCKRIIPASILVVVIAIAVCLAPCRLLASHTIYVTGTINERGLEGTVTANGLAVTAYDTWTGSLVGDGILHVFSAEFTQNCVVNAISTRRLFTSQGNLFLNEVGSSCGNVINATSTVAGGTGIYYGATGQLNLQGTEGSDGIVFTYTGSITLTN